MEQKNIVATIYLKNGQAVRGIEDHTPLADVIELAKLYNDNGIDKITIFDLSDDDEEHEKNIHTIKNINRNVEIKTCAGGNTTASRTSRSSSMPDAFRSLSTVPRRTALSLPRRRASVSEKTGSSCRWRMWTLCSNIRRRWMRISMNFWC